MASNANVGAQASCNGPLQDTIVCALNQASVVSSAQVAVACGGFAVVAFVTLFGFSVLRPNNKIVYAPKYKYAENGKQPPKIGDGFFDWIGPVWRYKEQDLLPLIGLDAVAYLRFGRMLRYMTSALAGAMCLVLMPVDAIYNRTKGKQDASNSSTNNLSIVTMKDVRGGSIWAHVTMSYIGTIIALVFLWFNYRAMLRLRWQFFRSEEYQTSFHARTLMITRVPKRLQSDEGLTKALADIRMPYPTTEVHIGREVGLLPDLIEKHQEQVRKLERVLAKYLKNPKQVGATRPTVRVGGMMGGKRVDAIDFYTSQINKTEAAIEGWRERIATKKPESYGFASLAAVPYAHAAAKSLRSKKPNGLKVRLAPPPNAIIWKNLTLTTGQKVRSSSIGFILLLALLFVNAVPLLAVSLISNMALFRNKVAFLDQWYHASAWSFAAVAGILPPLISGLAGYLLPILMRRIAKYRGVSTKTKLDKVILSQYFGYMIISQFIVFTLLGIGINLVTTLVKGIIGREAALKILTDLGSGLPKTIRDQYFLLGNYWLTWLPFRGYMAIFDLAQVVKLLLVWIQKGLFGRTPRDVREYTKPPHFDYAIYYANMLFICAVVMLYATLVPLVPLLGALAFWLQSVVSKYMLMFVCTTKHETGGGLWRIVANRLMLCIVGMQAVLALAVLLDNTSAWYRIVACLPPVLLVLAFKIYCVRTFDSQYTWYLPSGEEASEAIVHKGDARHHRLQRRFGHPSLHEKLWTPMVHAKVQHLLPNVYRGRIEASSTAVVDGRKMQTEKVEGGMRIALVEEDQLEYDPSKDSDSRSVMSGTTVGTGLYPHSDAHSPGGGRFAGVGAYGGSTSSFKQQYANYLAGGQNGQDEYEMGNVYATTPAAQGRGSQDNLLDGPPINRYSDSADGTLVGSGHARRPSGDLYKTHGQAPSLPGTPGFEGGFPPQRNVSESDPMTAGYGMYAPRPQPLRQPSQNSLQQQYLANGPAPMRTPPLQQAPRPGPPPRQNSDLSGYSQGGFVSASSSPASGPVRMVGGAPPGGAPRPPYAQPHSRSGSASSGHMLQGPPAPLQPGMVYSQAPTMAPRFAPAQGGPAPQFVPGQVYGGPPAPGPASGPQFIPGQPVSSSPSAGSFGRNYDPYAAHRQGSPAPQGPYPQRPPPGSDGSAAGAYYS